ncbi:hypothetical protein BYT27DRAFT_7138428 [Phlegmacium glaucopus]|nr:hypothetical protein BYT27DRAFT_7138428 [Phlegmacium glaucopus]
MNGLAADRLPPPWSSGIDEEPSSFLPHSSFSSSQILTMPTDSSLDSGLNIPATPTTPGNPDPKPKRVNPLTDLVDSEKAFVDQLTGIIRKVAAAWSRSNLPPPELDTMFRSIEGIYKANRGLHTKLKDISVDPKSAGELGGLLIKWIDDLKKPYETYCTKYCCGFDTWHPVQSNPRLAAILEQFSATNPAPSDSGVWTLDGLFLLPRSRLKYYQKLYNRLLKNTDNRLLIGAVETLNLLIATLDSRNTIQVGAQDQAFSTPPPLDTEDEVVIDMRTETPLRAENDVVTAGSESTSKHNSSSLEGESLPHGSEATSQNRASTQTLSMPISDLERRLVTDRTLDIFTMTSKAVKLHMSPPSLTFTREIRTSSDVLIRFTPRATGVEVIHRQGHIFLLSDLFLVCERIAPEDRTSVGENADMWLCYPPLAGKVLRVSEIIGQDNALQVAIMRKEFLILETNTKEERNSLIAHFKETIEFSSSLPPPSKQPPPPVPTDAFSRLHTDPRSSGSSGGTPIGDRTSGSVSPPVHQSTDARSAERFIQPDMKNRPEPQSASGPMTGQPYLRTSASAQPFPTRKPSLEQQHPIIPPARSTSFIPNTFNEPPAGPSFLPPNGQGGFANFPVSHSTNQPPYSNNPNARSLPLYPTGGYPPPRPPSDSSIGSGVRKMPSARSLNAQYSQPAPPLPSFPPGYHRDQPQGMSQYPRNNVHAPQPRQILPPQFGPRSVSMAEVPFNEPSPPSSPVQQPQDLGPVVSTISAQMKCKVFLQQQHAQWKSLGSAKLKLYCQKPTNIKQLVVEADNKEKSILISTIVLTDGVERVGKTGIAIELSDKGTRTGIIYMIQLRNETSAGGLFDSLLAGSDRAARG